MVDLQLLYFGTTISWIYYCMNHIAISRFANSVGGERRELLAVGGGEDKGET